MATVWDSLEDSKSPQNLLPRRDLVWLQHSAGSRRQIMGEKRAVHRRRVLKAGTIEFGGGVIDCTVRNLSKIGAALDVPTPVGIPETFTLTIPSDALRFACRVIYRKERRIV